MQVFHNRRNVTKTRGIKKRLHFFHTPMVIKCLGFLQDAYHVNTNITGLSTTFQVAVKNF